MIIEEMLAAKGLVDPTLQTFNEFIIKYRFDYSWDSEAVLRTREHISKDPFSEEMQKIMRMS